MMFDAARHREEPLPFFFFFQIIILSLTQFSKSTVNRVNEKNHSLRINIKIKRLNSTFENIIITNAQQMHSNFNFRILHQSLLLSSFFLSLSVVFSNTIYDGLTPDAGF